MCIKGDEKTEVQEKPQKTVDKLVKVSFKFCRYLIETSVYNSCKIHFIQKQCLPFIFYSYYVQDFREPVN